MPETLERLYDITLDYSKRIDEINMEELLLLVELRDQFLEQLEHAPPLTDEKKQKLLQIASCDEVIVSRMVQLRDEASKGLQKLSNTKLQKQTYETAYSQDSYFIDKRE